MSGIYHHNTNDYFNDCYKCDPGIDTFYKEELAKEVGSLLITLVALTAIGLGIACGMGAPNLPSALLQQKAWIPLLAGGGAILAYQTKLFSLIPGFDQIKSYVSTLKLQRRVTAGHSNSTTPQL